jgi:FixJ family two-component response regulator
MNDTNCTVVVVDDDPSIRRSVSRLIRSAGINVTTFASPVQFLRQELPEGPACVLLDMCMEGMTGLEVQEALGRNDRHVPIVFLTAHGTVPTAATGFKHGAADFLEKPFSPDALLDAIHSAIAQDRARCNERAVLGAFRRRYDLLTPREQEVMALVVSGQLNKQAAAELGISEKTIKVHRARVMEKMEVESLAELVLIAQRLGVASAPAPTQTAEGDFAETWPGHSR